MFNRIGRAAAVAALTLTAALAFTGCAGSATPVAAPASAAPAVTPTPTPTPMPRPNGTAAHPYPFGTLVVSTDGSAWDVTINHATSNDTATVLAANQYNSVKKGSVYVGGTMTAVLNHNLTSDEIGQDTNVSGSIEPVYVGGDGKIYTLASGDIAVLKNGWSDAPNVIARPGVKSSGSFAIEVPKSAVRGGQFAVRNDVHDAFVYFGPVQG